MIWYLFDFFVNNLNLFVSATIIFNLGNYEKRDFIYLLFVDIFINRFPVIFVSVMLLNILNKWIKLKFVNSYVLDTILFLVNYLLFFLVIYIYKNNDFNISQLLNYWWLNFIINYILFLVISKMSDFLIIKKYRVKVKFNNY